MLLDMQDFELYEEVIRNSPIGPRKEARPFVTLIRATQGMGIRGSSVDHH